MSFRGKPTLFLLALAVLTSGSAVAADALAELGKFSTFQQFDLTKVSGGKVVSARGPALDHPRDLAIQFVYVVPGPLAKVVEAHRQWDPSRHSELKVIMHGDVSAKPAAGDFAALAKPPGGSAVKALISATQKLPNKELQLSGAEAQGFQKGAGLSGWGPLLAQRASGFAARGLAGQPPYEVGRETIRPADEVTRLLKEQPKIRTQFRGLIDATPLGAGAGSLPAQLYWEMFDVDGVAALSLGASYAKDGAESAQLLDLQYYASGGYCVYFSLYQMWQITTDGKPATLVWRGDSIASQSLGELRGVEKMGSGAAMMAEVKKAVTLFLKDTGK
jgi:hypothetical protein